MRKKYIILIFAGLAVATAAKAGIDWVDYHTGEYQCTNGFKAQNEQCRQSFNGWTGAESCRKALNSICK